MSQKIKPLKHVYRVNYYSIGILKTGNCDDFTIVLKEFKQESIKTMEPTVKNLNESLKLLCSSNHI